MHRCVVNARNDCPSVWQPQVVGDIGSLNNVLTLSEHDCDVFTALNSDDAGKLSPPTADKCTSPPSSELHFLHVVNLSCGFAAEATMVGERSSSPAVCRSSSSRMRVIYHNWSATKQRPHPQCTQSVLMLAVISDANNGLNILYQRTIYHQLVLEVPQNSVTC